MTEPALYGEVFLAACDHVVHCRSQRSWRVCECSSAKRIRTIEKTIKLAIGEGEGFRRRELPEWDLGDPDLYESLLFQTAFCAARRHHVNCPPSRPRKACPCPSAKKIRSILGTFQSAVEEGEKAGAYDLSFNEED